MNERNLSSSTTDPSDLVANSVPALPASPAINGHTITKLVSGAKLLELLWEDSSRPTMRWLRSQTKRRAIPFARSAGRVWFDPSEVKASLSRVEIRRGRPRKPL